MKNYSSSISQIRIQEINLHNYRNYEGLHLSCSGQPLIFWGENGSGKTNLLEALSLLSPGRGLRRANYQDMQRHFCVEEQGGGGDFTSGFSVHVKLASSLYGSVSIGTGVSVEKESRKVRINGATSSANGLLEYCRVNWLSPFMDGLFLGAAGDRRKLLDRLVLSINPEHARHVSQYEKALRFRNRLLQEGSSDVDYYVALERQIAQYGVAIASSRVEFVQLLQSVIDGRSGGAFPSADLQLSGFIETELFEKSATDVESDFALFLADKRHLDRAAGRTLVGVHRSDLCVTHREKAMPAALCSTGEQKALLTGLILAHTHLTREMSCMTPILLLDEIAAHLDVKRREALFLILGDLGSQAVMTGTDRFLFSALEGGAEFYEVNNGRICW